jgi:hypothetical protein
MSEFDFTIMTNSASAASILAGVSAAPVKPNGGGTFVFGFNSLVTSAVTRGFYLNVANFNPLASGSSVRAALKRGLSSGTTGFAPILFTGIQEAGADVSGVGYLLGLSDDDPHAIILRKGSPNTGLAPTASKVLAISSLTFPPNTWVHVRLDVINNPNGDVVINCFYNDLALNAVTAPSWIAIPGISQVVDDALQVLTATAPLIGGRCGFAFQSAGLSRRGYVDHYVAQRQT